MLVLLFKNINLQKDTMLLHDLGLAAPETVELSWELNKQGFDLPLDRLDEKECAQVLLEALKA